ncbi:nidogen-2 [Heptranchias perlo]|uniref:nidogen-2 n=1 Tax=Heptranchias perlo TaxID=212740 RepID=UPI003559ED85
MQGKGFVLLLKLHCILSLVSAIQREDLFPFGPHTQDLTLQEGDDETSQVVKLKRPLVFYDTQFNNLYVGTNGIISTQDFPRETQYVDDGFPIDFPVIAPYLSDIDTSNGRGRIYYREDDSPDILDRAGQEIRRGFPQSSFTPTNAFVATWENVAPYEEVTRSFASSNRFNTFQALLAFDESNTYAIFLYPEDGLQFFGTRPKESYNVQIELPARVGFSKGEIVYMQWKRDGPFYSVTSNEQTVKNLYQMGNSGARGVWVFHIGGTSSFNNIVQAKVGGEPSREDSIVTLDSTLSGPVKPNILESDYTETEDYKQYYEDDDEEEFEYTPSVSTEPQERVDGIPEDPPYPDAGIIPSYPEGYPEAGIVSSYPESGALPSYPERYPEIDAGSSYPERYPEVRTGPRYPDGYSEVESLPRNPLPVTLDRHVVSVEEDEELGTGVFTYSTDTRETCERNQEQCSQHAYCADYSSGFCCHCHSGYYGNGRQCLPAGVTQRVNGKVNGKLMVGASRMPVEFQNADLHAYVVVNDGRAFTAISQIPEIVGWAMQSLSIIGDLFGWLFAIEQPGFKNGFSIAGAKFIRNVDVTFYPGNEKLNIIQIAQGLDAQNYLSVTTEIEGELPNIAQGATVQIQPYDELYHRSSSAMTSTAYREYSVESGNGETQTLRYQLRQNITYYDCEHAPRTIPATQQLNADRVFVLYDQNEQVVRYAMINQIGPARANSRPETVNPCQVGSHTCDVRAECIPRNEHDYICMCAPGYQGDGKVCTDIDECADGGSHGCGDNTDCINVAGSYGCECQRGFEIPEDGLTCVRIDQCAESRCHPDATCYNIPGSFVCECNPGYEGDGVQCRPVKPELTGRPKTACEEQRDGVQGEFSPRGHRPHFGIHAPQCDEQGNFRPTQCHSSTGQCWCVDEWGREIPGTRTLPGTNPPQCQVPEHPKTACEEQRDRVQAEFSSRGDQLHFGIHVPQCDEEGNFRPLQCHGSTGHCWCVAESGQEIPGTRTPPGTGQPHCGQPEPIERPKTACEQHRERLQTESSPHGSPHLVGMYIPWCDEEGNFRPLQCHGSTGYCWCVDERGQEIPGTRTPPGTGQPSCGLPAPNERPRTACEQHRERLQTEFSPHGSRPLIGMYIPQCDEEGNFRPLQCHGSTGHCWCVDESGQEIPGTRTPPGTGQPHCGQPEPIVHRKTACEQHQERLQTELSSHGSQHLIGMYIPQCDEEGNFRPLQCHGSTGHCWCVDEIGQEIPGTRTPPGTGQPHCGLSAPNERPRTACEQHQERLQTELSLRGSQHLIGIHIPQCDETGNFRPLQCHGSTGYCWCVDESGQEIPGTRTPPGTDQPRCGLPALNERPRTACEQHRERLQTELSSHGSQHLIGMYIPQCDEEGNFRPLQCHGSTGHCWCVDESGQEIRGTRTSPGTGQPHCGLPEPIERAKTVCEQHRERLQTELSPRGSRPLIGMYIPQCDEEGNFRPLQCHGSTGHCWCVDEGGQEIPGTRTPPGTGQPHCGQPAPNERPRTACEQHQERLQTELSSYGSRPLIGMYIPQCDEEGNFRPLQCHGSTGHCWCVDESGQEIPGTRTPPGTGQPHCGLPAPTERPKTACVEQRDQLQAELNLHRARPPLGMYIPQCDAEGNFRSLQCHGNTGHCWCVDEWGREIPGTRTLPGNDQPQCGLPEPIQRPQTVCERWRLSLLEHYGGIPADDQYIPQCNQFGDFSPLQCHGNSGYCWCVDKDGREIQGTRTEPGSTPACIPTVAPPIIQPTTAPVVTAPPTGTFLLYAQGQHIGYLPLNGTQLNKEGAKSLLALHGSIVIGIDYDCREKMVYWTDVAGRTINRVSLEPGVEPEILINSGLTSPEGLTIDYVRRNMFWTDSGSDKIEVAKVDGSQRRVLVDTDLVNPRAIVVDSLSGNLYWTDWNREAPKIETSHVDGTNRRVLVKNDIGLPNGLTFDPFSSQLCWADAGTKDLECIFPDGTGRHVVQNGLNYPFSVAAYSNHFYYTDWRRDGIIVVTKDGNQLNDEYLPDQRSHLYGITVAYPRCPHGRK